MSWFRRHLNWTWILGCVLALVVPPVMLTFVAAVADHPASWEDVGAMAVVAELVGIIIMLVISAWVIRQKGRSQWWLLLCGCFSPLWLSNKK